MEEKLEIINRLMDRDFSQNGEKNEWEIYDHNNRDLRIFIKQNDFRVAGKKDSVIDSRKIEPKRFFRLVDRLICEHPKPIVKYPKKSTKIPVMHKILLKVKPSFYSSNIQEYAGPVRWFKRTFRENFGARNYNFLWNIWKENYELTKYRVFVNQERI